jgi:hypothetical protein
MMIWKEWIVLWRLRIQVVERVWVKPLSWDKCPSLGATENGLREEVA